MKVVTCNLCKTNVIAFGKTAESCLCGNVCARYWEDECHYTLAVKNGDDSITVRGIHSSWIKFCYHEKILKDYHTIHYYLVWPYIKFNKIRLFYKIKKRITWEKSPSTAMCKTEMNGVTFYTYD